VIKKVIDIRSTLCGKKIKTFHIVQERSKLLDLVQKINERHTGPITRLMKKG
jgi:hypothetical protein